MGSQRIELELESESGGNGRDHREATLGLKQETFSHSKYGPTVE